MPAKAALIPGPPIIEIAVATVVLCVVSMLLGLLISTLVTKSDQTMPALVVVTMIEVVLSGGVFALGAGAEAYVSMIAPARWGLAAIASTINLNVITPANPLAPVKPDALWAHSASPVGDRHGHPGPDRPDLPVRRRLPAGQDRAATAQGRHRRQIARAAQSRPGPFDGSLIFVLIGEQVRIGRT